jgi:eukaryotic-like serine/threonine-protein kinase
MRLIGNDPPAPPPPDPDGDRGRPNAVGGYPLLRLLGVGGMSRVYLGYDRKTARQVAVKVLADHLSGDQRFVNRFYREAVLARSLFHPALVRGFDHGFDPAVRSHFLALEFVDGPTARAVVERVGRLPPGVAVRVATDVATALEYMHARGYVHRDVKPENVFLQPTSPAKLGDLGLAKRTAGDVALTAANQGVGTPHYMSYEQAVNAALVDGRSDVYSLGATLYHLLTGKVPYPDSESQPASRLSAVIPASRVCRDVPLTLDLVLERMLAGDPRRRYQTAADVVAALTAAGPAWTDAEYSEYVTRTRDAAPPEAELPTRVDQQQAG